MSRAVEVDVKGALQAAVQGERVRLRFADGLVAVVPIADLELLEAYEDELLHRAADAALQAAADTGEEPVPWDEADERLGRR